MNRRERRARMYRPRRQSPKREIVDRYGSVHVRCDRAANDGKFARVLRRKALDAIQSMVKDFRQQFSGGVTWSLKVREFRRSLKRQWRGR